MKKRHWMKIHSYLSLFLLPLALIYAITGALYILGFDDRSGAKITTLKLESKLDSNNLDSIKEAMLTTLTNNNQKIPNNTTIKEQKGNFVMGSTKYSVMLDAKNNELKIVERSLYGVLVLMHKAKGNKISGLNLSAFDILGIIFGISLILFYVSALFATSFYKNKTALLIILIGFIITSSAVYVSGF